VQNRTKDCSKSHIKKISVWHISISHIVCETTNGGFNFLKLKKKPMVFHFYENYNYFKLMVL